MSFTLNDGNNQTTMEQILIVPHLRLVYDIDSLNLAGIKETRPSERNARNHLELLFLDVPRIRPVTVIKSRGHLRFLTARDKNILVRQH